MTIPFGAVIEIERGIANLANRDAYRAYMLSEWLRSLISSDIIFLPMNFETARLYGRMTSVPALRDLWVPSPFANKPKLGQDLSIAATAIVIGAPIASMNIKDFVQIDRFFPLPGLYNPAVDEWRIRPRSRTPVSAAFPLPQISHRDSVHLDPSPDSKASKGALTPRVNGYDDGHRSTSDSVER